MTPTPHPAKFADAVLAVMRDYILPTDRVLDPFAGVGKIHAMCDEIGAESIGIEIEPEWAGQHPRTFVGNALHLQFPDGFFDVVATSCVYGNRMSDHHEAREVCRACGGTGHGPGVAGLLESCEKCDGRGSRDYKRMTYRHQLGRPLHPDNSGQLQWGSKYREFHIAAWREVRRVLRPGGLFLLNIKDHVRGNQMQPVARWHGEVCRVLGFELVADIEVKVDGMGFGQNREARAEFEHVLVMKR